MPDDTPLPDHVRRTLERLAPKAPRFVVAVSGGSDSVAALRLVHEAGLPLVAAHFDHRLREASAEDARFVRDLCAGLGVPLVEGGADVVAVAAARGWNLEDAARRLRYAFLHRVLAEEARGGAIVVAHTLEDQAETVLLQLLRGTAHPTGMRPRSRAVVRPLLDLSRQALRAYLSELGQAWREDASNADVSRNRAWLRHEVVPRLEERFPGAQARLAATAQRQQQAHDALGWLARRRFPDGPIRLAAWRAAPVALRHTALAERLERAGAAPNARLLDEIDAAASRAAREPGAAPWRKALPGGAEARVGYGELAVLAPSELAPAPALPDLRVTDAAQLPPGVDPRLLERYPEPELRARRPGDRIRLPGGSKLVSDLLIDRKVPRRSRDARRVLAAGSEVFWVEGVAFAQGAAAPGVDPALADPDRYHMRQALAEARAAAAAGEVPVGAVVVLGGRVLAAAHNRTEAERDPTAHAELLALRAAARAAGDWRLAGATLYVTLEPCPMCLGAILQTQLERVVYGADNLRDGALGGVADLSGEGWKRVPRVTGGVEAAAAARLLQAAFAAKR